MKYAPATGSRTSNSHAVEDVPTNHLDVESAKKAVVRALANERAKGIAPLGEER
jgi:hypothetical protein